jgi:hypothetical protein
MFKRQPIIMTDKILGAVQDIDGEGKGTSVYRFQYNKTGLIIKIPYSYKNGPSSGLASSIKKVSINVWDLNLSGTKALIKSEIKGLSSESGIFEWKMPLTPGLIKPGQSYVIRICPLSSSGALISGAVCATRSFIADDLTVTDVVQGISKEDNTNSNPCVVKDIKISANNKDPITVFNPSTTRCLTGDKNTANSPVASNLICYKSGGPWCTFSKDGACQEGYTFRPDNLAHLQARVASGFTPRSEKPGYRLAFSESVPSGQSLANYSDNTGEALFDVIFPPKTKIKNTINKVGNVVGKKLLGGLTGAIGNKIGLDIPMDKMIPVDIKTESVGQTLDCNSLKDQVVNAEGSVSGLVVGADVPGEKVANWAQIYDYLIYPKPSNGGYTRANLTIPRISSGMVSTLVLKVCAGQKDPNGNNLYNPAISCSIKQYDVGDNITSR